MKDVTVKIDNKKYKTVMSNGTHEVISDEPLPYGGDFGPTPYDFLLMSLGGCVAMTLRMYADRKDWDLQNVEVQLSQKRMHYKDCDDCNSEEGHVHLIEKQVKLIGNLDEAQRKRLMEIADKCPVHKTLLNEVKIKTVEVSI